MYLNGISLHCYIFSNAGTLIDMFRELLFFNIILSPLVLSRRRHQKKESLEELGGTLITSLRNDANLDLSMDEEYEDLRAELLAYHTALSSLSGTRVDDGSLPPEVAEAVAAEPGNNVGLETRSEYFISSRKLSF